MSAETVDINRLPAEVWGAVRAAREGRLTWITEGGQRIAAVMPAAAVDAALFLFGQPVSRALLEP